MRERLRIFISSPGDVTAPREIAAQTIERLAQDFARFFAIDPPYLWQNEPLDASRHFQDDIEAPSNFDIVILILQQRLGTPLPEKTAVRAYCGIDGRTPVTGTEWEYEDALKAARETGAPDLLVYRSRAQASIDSWNPEKRAAQLQQLEALDKFWARHFANKGVFLGAYTEFGTLDEFAASLDNHLRKLLKDKIEKQVRSGTISAGELWTQAPFRGLESYEFEHAQIFFGQDDAIRRGMLQLKAHAADGVPFLIVLGASGSGKSSLVKAGIVPKLFVPRRVTGSAFLRRVEFCPSEAREGEDLFDALARAFVTGKGPSVGLPELVTAGQPVAALAQHLRTNRSAPVYPIAILLDQLATAARGTPSLLEFETAKLVLVLDQLEELFTNDRFRTEERKQFIELIKGLVHSGRVWVIAAMRKDFWHRADEVPELVELADEQGRIELLPPSPAQLGQMIRRPAEAAGLEFETMHDAVGAQRSGLALNEVIAEEVAREPGALPLLSYLLDQLYRKDVLETGGRLLSFATYERLGKLEGAIATKADEVIAQCARDDRAALGSVLFSLVQIGVTNGDVDRAVARRVSLSEFPENTARRRLIDAFLDADARLLVSDVGEAGSITVRVAHEALLTHWPQAKSLIADARTDLQLRARLEQAATQWERAAPDHRESLLLHRGLPLSEAEDFVTRRRDDLSKLISDYVAASTDLSTREQRRRLRQSRQIAGAAVASAAVFCSLAIFAAVSWRKSERSLDAATAAISGLVDTFNILPPVAKLDEVQALVDRARNAIDGLSGIASDSRLIEERARTLMIIASIDFDRGQAGQMNTDANRALALLNIISSTGQPKVLYERANSYRLLGLSNYELNKNADARADFETAISELKSLLDKHPNSPDSSQWRKTLGETHQLLGDVLLDEYNDPRNAEIAYAESYRIRQELKRTGDGGPELTHDLAFTANKLGDVEGRIGHDDEALKWFEIAKKQMEGLGGQLVLWPLDLALIENNIGLVLMRKGEYLQAITSFQAAEVHDKSFIDRDPRNNIRQSVLGWTYDNMGETLIRWAKQTADRPKLTQARAALEKALAIRQEVAREAPEKPLFRAGVLNTRANIANVDATLSEWDSKYTRAATLFGEAADLIQQTYSIHIKQYARPDRLLQAVELLRSSAAGYRKSGQATMARAQLEHALKLLHDNSAQFDAKIYDTVVREVTHDYDAIQL